MKKLIILAMIIPLVLIIGITLDSVGYATSNETLIYVGALITEIGVPISMILVIAIGLPMFITGKWSFSNDKKDKDSTDEDQKDSEREDVKSVGEREKEYLKIAEINTSDDYIENRNKSAEYDIEHSANIYQNSSTAAKILGWAFLSFIIINVSLVIIFAFFGNKVGAYVCFGLFAGALILVAIGKFISEKVSLNAKINTKSKKRKILDGKVKHCFLSSTINTSNEYDHHHRLNRIDDVTYRVVVTANGKDYNAYTKYFYETGEDVKIAVIGGRRAKIVTEKELKESESLLK